MAQPDRKRNQTTQILQTDFLIPMDTRHLILEENGDFLVVNKPSGLLTIPDRHDSEAPSLLRILQQHYESVMVVHRIDRDTSGLMLFARNPEMHQYLNTLFEERKMKKEYLGLVYGSVAETKGRIEIPIAEHPVKKGTMVTTAKGKPAVTEFEVLEDFGKFSWLRFNIQTGRTHQIRVHMKHYVHPLVCDPIYGNGKELFLSEIKKGFKLSKNEEAERPLLSRLALHAATLRFTDPNGTVREFEAPLSKDLQAVVRQLGKWKRS